MQPARPTSDPLPDSRAAALAERLTREIEGDVRCDRFTRGLYATDASHYQIEPLGVAFPRRTDDVEAILAVAREEGVPVMPRGGGTSQCGQALGRGLVVDVSRHLGRVEAHDGASVVVEAGVVLDDLNRTLRPHGVWFPVDPSTGSRATLGGMAGNNSAGARSLRYGMMVDNVLAVEAVLADGRRLWLGEGGAEEEVMPAELAALRALYAREAEEIARRAPATSRDVAGYRLERLAPASENLGSLLVGSEGTLAFFTRLRLALSPLPARKVLGVCHFATLHDALDAVRHIVALEPTAVELVDENVVRLAAGRPQFRDRLAGFVRGTPGALLLVELAVDRRDGADARLARRLDALAELQAALPGAGPTVRVTEPARQADVWSVRKAGLNIVMSMAGPRKPVSFVEDCAVPLDRLAEYADRVGAIFRRHGSEGTWYAHASVGCLHVRPALDLRDPDDVALMRRIAGEVHEVVAEMRGTHSGEHGDGILRSEFLATMRGERIAAACAEVKRTLDPGGLLNPGKIVDPPAMDDRTLLRHAPGRAAPPLPVVLDGAAEGGLLDAAERCNNNGACRKRDPGLMCPSYRATGDERHSTRGRANGLRLALTGGLGPDALADADLAEALSLCVSCKGCRSECPTGVDMARLKAEVQHHRNSVHGVPLRERLLAALPRAAPWLGPAGPAVNALARSGRLRALAERHLGIAADRPLPVWHPEPWQDDEIRARRGAEVVLFVDTFSRWFEPEIPRAAAALLAAAGWRARAARPAGGRPLCCGRTWLSAGMLAEARREGRRLLDALAPAALGGAWIAGLEPSCLLTLRDELPGLLPGPEARAVAERAVLLEELLEGAAGQGRAPPLSAPPGTRVLVHGHCHQKALGAFDPALRLLRRVPGLEVETVPGGCCGMAGAFGYHAEHRGTSAAIAELDVLPAVRAAAPATHLLAAGTSCRAQIRDGTGRTAEHPAVFLEGLLG